MMMCLSKWISATLAIALMASTAVAADTVTFGKIKSINAEKKTFVLTDYQNKEQTLTLGEKLVVNRDGKESKTDVKAGDSVHICYDKGTFTWTAHYILIVDGKHKDDGLLRGTIKSYDPEKKEMTFASEGGKNMTFATGDAKVRLNMEDSKFSNVRIGDHALLIISPYTGKSNLQSVMIDRAK